MKRVLVFALCVAGLLLLTAPTAVERSPLAINGKAVGGMIILQNGVWAVSLEDVARALGAPITLEPVLSLQGNRLTVKQPGGATAYKPQKPDGSLDAGIHFKYDLKAQKEARMAPGQFLGVIQPGVISSHVTMMNGKAYVPVADLVRAFGDGSVHGNLTGPLQPGGVNVHINGNSNLAGLIGLL